MVCREEVMNQEERAKPLQANHSRYFRLPMPDDPGLRLSIVLDKSFNGAQQACGHPPSSRWLYIHDGLPHFPPVGLWRGGELAERSRTKLFGFPSIVH